MDVVQQQSSPTDVIIVNVGGVLYTTTVATLTKFKESELANWFGGRQQALPRDPNGNPFIDRDGPMFGHVLNFLRNGRLVLPGDFREHEKLESDARFYQIQPLIDAVSQRQSGNIVEMYHVIMEKLLGDIPLEGQLLICGDQSVMKALSMYLQSALPNDPRGKQPKFSSSMYDCTVHQATSKDKTAIFDHLLKTGWQLVSSSLATSVSTKLRREYHYIWRSSK